MRNTSEPRVWIRRGAGLALALLFVLVGCRSEPERLRETLLVFGSEANIDVVGVEPIVAERAIAAAAVELATMNREWHAWQASDLTRINAAFARGEAAEAPDSVRLLIQRCKPLVLKSGKLFDPGAGGLIELWGFHTDRYPITTPPPDDATLDAWLTQAPSLLDVSIDGTQVRSRNPAVQLDFGAMGEGAAAERVGAVLQAHRINDALISLGGDLLALGRNGDAPWQVAVRDPFAGPDSVLASIELDDGEALFTSGNYNRYRLSQSGERWAHIVNPRTGRPVSGVAQSLVLHRDPVLADVAATALMVGGPARFSELLNRLGIHCAMLLTEQDELIITQALAPRVGWLRQPARLGPPLGAATSCDG